MPMNAVYERPGDLAAVIPVFPLAGALLLPRGQMPLNIFEPRYLAMIDDALARRSSPDRHDPARHRASGIRRTVPTSTRSAASAASPSSPRPVTAATCIQLTGIARFRIEEELTVTTPYRQCQVNYAPFADDFTARKGEDAVDRKAVLRALASFLKANNLKADWDGIENAPNEALVNALAMMSPYGAAEKQALLEAPDLKTRAEMLVAMTEIELAKKTSGGETPLQ